jgi:hypothetical protein
VRRFMVLLRPLLDGPTLAGAAFRSHRRVFPEWLLSGSGVMEPGLGSVPGGGL